MPQPMNLPDAKVIQSMKLDDLIALHTELANTNDARLQDAEAKGWTPDPLDLLYDRIDLLLQAIFPGRENRLRFELSYEIRVQQKLNQATAELAKPKLEVPATPTINVPRDRREYA